MTHGPNAITDDELVWLREQVADEFRDSIELWTISDEPNAAGAVTRSSPVYVRTLPGLIGPPRVSRPWEAGRAATEREVKIILAFDADLSVGEGNGTRLFRRAGESQFYDHVSDNTGSSLRDGTVVVATFSDVRADLVPTDG